MAKADTNLQYTTHQWINDLREHYDVQGDDIISKYNNQPIGWKDANGIKVANMFGQHHTIAKLIWIHQHGKMPKGQIRKRDLDAPATIDNLYDTQDTLQTAKVKARLYTSLPRNPEKKVSQVTGVSWWASRKRWRVVLKGQYHGSFENMEDAERKCRDVMAAYEAEEAARRRVANMQAMQYGTYKGNAPSADKLHDLFRYNPDTGNLYNRDIKRNSKPYAGNLAANPFPEALRVGSGKHLGSRESTMIDGERYYVDQIVWSMFHEGDMPSELWHLNGSLTDTRVSNLTNEQPSKEQYPYAVKVTTRK